MVKWCRYVGAVDLKKAFDLVDYGVLLHKLDLHHFSTSPLHLMKSYIYDRSQLVKIGDVHSDVRKLKAGVPQASILGPISYLHQWYVIIQNSSTVDWYADDFIVHESG